MATITPPARTRNLSESNQRVRSPLTRLRGYIRGYVSLEGALLLVLLLALWFWISLAIDYGAFKLFAFDWVQEWHWAVRLVGDQGNAPTKLAEKLADLAVKERDVEVRSQLASSAKRLPASVAD